MDEIIKGSSPQIIRKRQELFDIPRFSVPGHVIRRGVDKDDIPVDLQEQFSVGATTIFHQSSAPH